MLTGLQSNGEAELTDSSPDMEDAVGPADAMNVAAQPDYCGQASNHCNICSAPSTVTLEVSSASTSMHKAQKQLEECPNSVKMSHHKDKAKTCDKNR